MKSCGDCQACCWFFPLAFLNKPMRTNCQHQCDNGCAIHDKKRHPVCETFICEWKRRPQWGEELRPDMCDIIYQARCGMGNGRLIIQASQFSPYSWLRRENLNTIDSLTRAGHIVLRTYRDEEGIECLALRDKRRYPMVTTNKVLKRVREAIATVPHTAA
jgi:hypothetical protein